MPLVPAVVLVMLGIGLTEWAEPRSVWPLIGPAFGLVFVASIALALGRERLAMGLGWFGLLWIGASCHYLQRGPDNDELGRTASDDYRPLVFRAEITGVAVWRPNSFFRAGQDESQRWRTQWKILCYEVRDGQQWRRVHCFSTLTVSGRLDHLLPGDCVQVFGSCARVPAPSNPGESDLRKVFREEHQFVFLRAETADQIALDRSHWRRPVARLVAIAVRQIDHAIHGYVPFGQAALAAALVFGQRQQVDWESQQQLLSTGTLHMLAISGMHIELVAGSLWLLCLLIGVPQRTSLIIIATIVTLYALIAGANPPVLRAVFTVLAVCVARFRGRRRGLANLLAFSGLCVLAIRTSWIGNVGVQLSFLAVATIALFAQGATGRGDRADALAVVIEESWTWRERSAMFVGRWAWQLASLSFWVWLMTAPLIWMNFHVVSLVAIPLNILLWPFLVVGLLSGLGLAITGWCPPIAWPLGLVCGACLWCIGGIVWIGDALLLGHVWLPAPPIWWTSCFYVLAAIGVGLMHFRPWVRRWLAVVLCLWLGLGILPWVVGPRGHGPAWMRGAGEVVFSSHSRVGGENPDGLRITFVDVGHGTSVLMEMPGGDIWLYDAGHLGSMERSHQEIANVLWSLPTARVDRLFVSHADADHYNAIPGLVERFSVGEVVAPVQFWQHPAAEMGQLRSVIHQNRIPAERIAQGEQFDCGQVHIEVLHPPADWSDKADNGNSLTLLIEYAGRSLLLPGDLEKAGLERLLSQPQRNCDLLMAPHHGSMTHDPRAVFRWCQPEWIVVSGGPRSVRPDVIDRYSPQGSQSAFTHRDGAIQFRIDSGGSMSAWHWSETRWLPLSRLRTTAHPSSL